MSVMWEGKIGDAFFRPDGLKQHLHVVLFDPQQYPGYGTHTCIVRVNITSVYTGKYYDPSCILDVGDHPSITHKSYVLYEKLEIEQLEPIRKCVNSGVYRPATPVTPELLLRMQQGAKISDDLPRKHKKIIP